MTDRRITEMRTNEFEEACKREVGHDIVWVLPKVLAKAAASTANVTPANPDLAVFFGTRVPSIDLFAYFSRLSKHFNCSPECYVTACVYIIRIVMHQPKLVVNDLSVHRLLFTSLVLAVKFHDDDHYPNAYYAKIGGVTTDVLNSLELAFLTIVEWKLHVSTREFEKYYDFMRQYLPKSRGTAEIQRGEQPNERDQSASLACIRRTPAAMTTNVSQPPPSVPDDTPSVDAAAGRVVPSPHSSSVAVVALGAEFDGATKVVVEATTDKQRKQKNALTVRQARRTCGPAAVCEGPSQVKRFQSEDCSTSRVVKQCQRSIGWIC
eukprot:TRINITY_DN70982_c0_g1_i1.p1 TRINITY_DN70982_c0_g1~~TRINITY_DN70982_c0_g1_i1.p1  ORF type:complete len:321 (-),score=58.42 TRINITY_DN70982_c0_g1_i1:485-1447(-)